MSLYNHLLSDQTTRQIPYNIVHWCHLNTAIKRASPPVSLSPGFGLPRQQWSLNTLFTQNRDTAVPAEGNGNLQTLICVPMARPRRCPTLSNPVPSQNWMAAYLGYTLRMKMLFHGWPIMVHETHTRRRRRVCHLSCQWSSLAVSCHDIWNRAQFTVCRHCGCFRETQVIRDNGVSPY